jgi:hypothetical protein
MKPIGIKNGVDPLVMQFKLIKVGYIISFGLQSFVTI